MCFKQMACMWTAFLSQAQHVAIALPGMPCASMLRLPLPRRSAAFCRHTRTGAAAQRAAPLRQLLAPQPSMQMRLHAVAAVGAQPRRAGSMTPTCMGGESLCRGTMHAMVSQMPRAGQEGKLLPSASWQA